MRFQDGRKQAKMEENANVQQSMRTRTANCVKKWCCWLTKVLTNIRSVSTAQKWAWAATDIQDDVNQQARTLANDEAHFKVSLRLVRLAVVFQP